MNKLIAIIALIIFTTSMSAFAQSTGTVAGKVVDEETGEVMIGATVRIKDTQFGAMTKVDGSYTIKNVKPGIYTMVVTYIGYAKTEVTDVRVEPGEVTKLDVTMQVESSMTDEVVITAKALENTEASLLADRQKSNSVSDAISAEMISKTGSGNAADAMAKVTGVSIVDGEHVYVRGLGDRYTHTSLNGSSLASTDPDKNSVSTDIFDSDFIENIVTIKSFTPDKPGNFTGGAVDIKTKSFPEKESFNVKTSSTYNTQSSLSDKYLSYSGSSTDWLGYDNGKRARPQSVIDAEEIPNEVQARFDQEKAYQLDRMTNDFNSEMTPSLQNSGLNQSIGLSYGNSFEMGENQMFGVIFGANYGTSYSLYNDAISGQYQLKGAEAPNLDPIIDFSDSKGSRDVNWGSMLNMSYAPDNNNTIGVNLMYNKSAENWAQSLSGFAETIANQEAVYETRTLGFQERDVTQLQLNGEHNISADFFNNAQIEWNVSQNTSTRDEPDLRFFTNHYVEREVNGQLRRDYLIARSNYSEPAHYYRDLQEDLTEFNFNYLQPINITDDYKMEFKVGGTYLDKYRTFNEYRYILRTNNPQYQYNGNPEEYFSRSNLGIVDSSEIGSTKRYTFANFLVDQSIPQNNYTGAQEIIAYYAMVNMPITDNLKFVGGARVEITDIDVNSADSSKNFSPEGEELGVINTNDLLPSINLIYKLGDDMNVRASYGRTLARPTFRELSPFPSFDFIGGFILNGNQQLNRTLIDNYDLRWEWFFSPGEIVAVSAFYKRFDNPIEIAIVSNNNQTQYQNVPEGRALGIEFEARTNLDFVDESLSQFSIGGNLTLLNSQVDIPEKTLNFIRDLRPDAPSTRPMFGQSPYLLNLMLGYDNDETNTFINLSYNVFGDRLSKISLGGTPNVYERTRGNLDINIRQEIFDGVGINVMGSNLLNPYFKESHMYEGEEYIVSQYRLGANFKIGFNFSL